MNQSRLKRAHGNWVEGDRFWNREKELALFVESLEEGANLLLVAPRRIGKTSLMREAARRMQERFICLQVDLQKAHSAADAVVALSIATRPHDSLWVKTKGLFANILNRTTEYVDSLQFEDLTVTLRSGLTEGDWQAKGDRLFATLATAEKPVVIFFDEVAILVNRLLKGDDYRVTPERRQLTDAFMSWLRQNSIDHKGEVRLVVTGSIGIEPILRQVGLSATLNAFEPFDLGPWNAATAQACVQALANEYGLTFPPQALDAVTDRLGCCIPHHVQMFFDNIYRACKLRDLGEVSEELVEEVYATKMIGLRGHAELSHLEERLKLVLGVELYPLALDLLTETAVTGHLALQAIQILCRQHTIEDETRTPEDTRREILGVLEYDGYLSRRGDSYTFTSNLLRDWWKAHFDLGYVPAAKREEALS